MFPGLSAKFNPKKIYTLLIFLVLFASLFGVANAQTVYDFNDPNQKAFGGMGFPKNPETLDPANHPTWVEASSSDYSNIRTSDNVRWDTSHGELQGYRSQLYRFTINEDQLDVNRIDFFWEGFGENIDSSIKIWNFNTNAWEDRDTTTFPMSETTRTVTLSGNIINYINPSNRHVTFLVSDYYEPATSCPFVYSYDGKEYVFEHEAIPMNVLNFLEDSTHKTLRNLEPVNGYYNVKITEELDEISYVNGLEIKVVDSSENVEIIPDINGNIHTIKHKVLPLSAFDKKGNNVLEKISNFDNLYWVRDLNEYEGEEDIRDYVELEFENKRTDTKLVVRAKESGINNFIWDYTVSLIGENNFHAMENLYSLPLLREPVENTMKREIWLKIQVWDGNDWINKGFLKAGTVEWGEFLIYLDTKDIKTDTLKIRLFGSTGFWKINHVYADFSADEHIDISTSELVSAIKNDGKNVVEDLKHFSDDRYLTLPKGDHAILKFKEIPERIDKKRSYVVSVSGYYHAYIRNNQSAYELLTEAIPYITKSNEDGYIAKISINKWLEKGTDQNIFDHNTLYTDHAYLTIYTTSGFSCYVQSGGCNSGDTAIFKMSDLAYTETGGAHADKIGYGTFNFYVCCRGITGLGNTCSNVYTTALMLSDNQNAHAEIYPRSPQNYNVRVCMSVPSGTINCIATNPGDNCHSNSACLTTLSDFTNAHVSDCDGDNDDYDIKICCGTDVSGDSDITPPHTSISLDGTRGWNEWYTNNVQITLTCIDALANGGGGITSGCDYIQYCTDTTNTCDPTTGTKYTPSVKRPCLFDITNEGTTYLRYYSVDKAGNREMPTKSRSVKIDKTPPTFSSTDGYSVSGCDHEIQFVNGGSYRTCWVRPNAVTSHSVTHIDTVSTPYMQELSFTKDGCDPETCNENEEIKSSVNTNTGELVSLMTDGISISSTVCSGDCLGTSATMIWTAHSGTDSNDFKIWVMGYDEAGKNVGYDSTEWWLKIDAEEPEIAMISINNGATSTSTRDVTLSLTYSDTRSGINDCRYRNENEEWIIDERWEACSATKSWTLSDSDGEKTVYYQVRDNVGNVKEENAVINLVTTAPITSLDDNYPTGQTTDTTPFYTGTATPTTGVDIDKIEYRVYKENAITLKVDSAGFDDGNYVNLFVNDVDEGTNNRGYNLVVVDPDTGQVIDRQAFDTYAAATNADAMADYISNQIPSGSIVLVGVMDEASRYMNDAAYQALESLGSKHARNVGWRDSHTFIGIKGAPIGSIPEVHTTQFNGISTVNDVVPEMQWTDVDLITKNNGNYLFEFTITESMPDDVYYFEVRAKDSIENWESNILFDETEESVDKLEIMTAGPEVRILPLSDWVNTKEFTVEWETLRGVTQTYDVQYKIGDGSWTDWLMRTDSTSAVFPQDSGLTVEDISDGDTYSFRVKGTNDLGVEGSYSSEESITIDASGPSVTIIAYDQFGNVVEPGKMPPGTTRIKIRMDTTDSLSGISITSLLRVEKDDLLYDESNCEDLTAGETCTREVSVDVEESTKLRYEAIVRDNAGNEMTSGPFFLSLHYANFVTHDLFLTIGNSFVAKVNVRNLDDTQTDDVILILRDGTYSASEFIGGDGKEGAVEGDGDYYISNDKKTLYVYGLNSYEERTYFVKIWSSDTGTSTLVMDANSVGNAQQGPDGDSMRIVIDYPASFPGLNEWSIMIILLLAGSLYYFKLRKWEFIGK